MNQKNLLMAAMALLCGIETSFAQSHKPGQLIWSFATGGSIASSPAIGPDGTIYVGSDDHNLYAINTNGTRRWVFSAANLVESSPMIGPDGTIYVGSHDNKLYAVNPGNGKKRWEYVTGNDIASSPAIASDGTIYVGSLDRRLHAIDSEGFLVWYFDAGAAVWASPAVAPDGTIYVGAGTNFFAVNPDGKQKWVFSGSDTFYSSAAIADDGTIYVGCLDRKLYALSSAGAKVWESKMPKDIYASPSIGADGIVYLGCYDGRLYAVRTNGFQKWKAATGSAIHSSPAIAADGTVYVGSNDRKIYSFKADGTINWTFTTGGAVRSSPAISADGIVYAGSNDKKLYAIQGSTNLAGTSWPAFRHDSLHSGESVTTNRTPVLNPLPNRTVAAGELLEFTVTAIDPDGNRLTFTLDPGFPTGATINSTNGLGLFSWTPTGADVAGDHTVIVRVTDGGLPSLSDFRVVKVTVTGANSSPMAAPVGDRDTSSLSDTKSSLIAIAAPAASGISRSNRDINLSWTAIVGTTYRVQYKTNLEDQVWLDLGGPITPTNATATMLDKTLGAAPQRFYRMVQP